ncbi:hypothetical protein L861_02745 [Litchfieldella anticariensis FP35 = DSM 16096]|uniref:Major pilin protein fimA n=1 Tax=Litchfieldella anticariensis (strain DSM 16096 / CECT 5854 / CIP 108499 / LMG 22089 / FP35) TaxID=1121939 RepID=S2KQA5_LITA3|nr:DUF1028 domain-containing protein [Halomonas anticariensis]EPC04252.1 hypothetical protein L861_02745 [Halomonas anticariensis FP35 = DSM 16096]
MTFTLMARDPVDGTLGIATATGSPAVGGFVPHLLPGVGAVITQGYSTSLLAAERALAWLVEGKTVETIVDTLRRDDKGAAWRQVAVMDASGHSAGWTGEYNVASTFMHCGDDLVVAGNMLVSALVGEAIQRAFRMNRDLGLPEALLAGLAAGQATGGDTRGTLSAALLVRREGGLPLDLRIDEGVRAVDALDRLYRRIQINREFQAFLSRLPTAESPHRH